MMASGGVPRGSNDPEWLKPLLAPPPPAEAKSASRGDDALPTLVGEEASAAGQQRQQQREQKRRRITKPFFAVLATITVLAAITALATNVYELVADGQEEKSTGETADEGADRVILRGFGVALSFLVVPTELGFKWWRRLCPLLDYLFARGVFYSLVSFLTVSEFGNWTEPSNVVGLILLCCAGCYAIAGLLCLRRTHTLE